MNAPAQSYRLQAEEFRERQRADTWRRFEGGEPIALIDALQDLTDPDCSPLAPRQLENLAGWLLAGSMIGSGLGVSPGDPLARKDIDRGAWYRARLVADDFDVTCIDLLDGRARVFDVQVRASGHPGPAAEVARWPVAEDEPGQTRPFPESTAVPDRLAEFESVLQRIVSDERPPETRWTWDEYDAALAECGVTLNRQKDRLLDVPGSGSSLSFGKQLLFARYRFCLDRGDFRDRSSWGARARHVLDWLSEHHGCLPSAKSDPDSYRARTERFAEELAKRFPRSTQQAPETGIPNSYPNRCLGER